MRTLNYISDLQDLSDGVIAAITSRKRQRPKHARKALNMYGRGRLGAARIRPGTRDISTATLASQPHSLIKFYSPAAQAVFVGAGTKLFRAEATAYPEQTGLPVTLAGGWLSHDNLNNSVVVTERGGAAKPFFYDGNSWKALTLPSPAATLTLTPGTTGTGGMTASAVYFYRLRWLFKNGGSKSSTPQTVTLGALNDSVALSTIPLSARDDFLSWRLERTEAGATADGPYYFDADGTIATYTDELSDASLDYQADEGRNGEPPHMDGVIAFGNRIIGWAGSALYCSASPGEYDATGIANFDADLTLFASRDDGDDIQLCVKSGEELVIFKEHSVHRLIGTGPDNWQLLRVDGAETGAIGPRCAAAMAGGVIYLSRSGFYLYRGGLAIPFGSNEVGEYLEQANVTVLQNAVLVNNLGDFILAFYPSANSTINDQCLVYDLRLGQWWPWDGWYVADALAQRDGAFENASLIFADARVSASTAVYSELPAFAAWSDELAASTDQHLVQKIDTADGSAEWTANGVIASAATVGVGTYFNRTASCVARSDGGMIHTGYEQRAGGHGIWAHRLDSAGAHQWTGTTGAQVKAPTAGNTIGNIVSCHDGANGIIVQWLDSITGPNRQFANRIDASGAPQWGASGVQLGNSGTSTSDADPEIRPDGSGGAWCIWRAAVGGVGHLFAQRVTAAGALVFGAAAIDYGVVGMSVAHPVMAVSSDGFLFVALLSTANTITIKKIDPAAGAVVWTSVNLSPGRTVVNDVVLSADSNGGAMVFYRAVNGGGNGIFGQAVDSAGTVRWPSGTLFVAAVGSANNEHQTWAVEDGAGGAIVVYSTLSPLALDLFAIKVNNDSTLPWVTPTQLDTGTAGGSVYAHPTTDGAGGVVVFFDSNLTTGVAYAARVNTSGVLLWAVTIRAAATGSRTSLHAGAYQGASVGEYVEAGQPGHHVWVGFDGFRDEKTATGAFGNGVPWFVESPPMDDADIVGKASNQPKEYGRLQSYLEGDPTDISITVTLDPSGLGVSLQSSIGGTGKNWGAELVADDDDMIWDEDDWAGEQVAPITTACPIGTIGVRYSIRHSGVTDGDLTFYGSELDCVLRPERPVI